ncbi:MAG: hypothetical protein GXO74_00195, partial [Calditrichaeota bacterium]|nr:hypothetical protein [Calditrichota bacterium]
MNGRRIFSLAIFLIVVFAKMTLAGQLTSVTVTPSNNAAGAPTIYTFGFTTSATGNGVDVGIPADGKVVIIFPAGFDLTSAELAQSTDLGVLDGGLTTTVSGDTIFVTRDGTGSVIAGNTAVGLKVAVVGNHQTAATTYQVQMETRLSDDTQIDSGTSANFTVTHGSLATFNFAPIGNQTAGAGFAITITAVDNYGNTVETFSNTVTLSDLSATLSPTTTTSFSSGVWSGTVVINQSYQNDNITATYQNIAGTSNNFNVNAGSLDHFTFQTISSPQTAGAAFSVTITAADAQGNQVTDFTDIVNLSDSTGTISPTVTGNFVAGQWTGNVSMTQARKDVAIIATYGAIVSSSNLFNMQSAALANFSISTIANQTAGAPFSIQVTAQDQYGNTVENFTETADISDLTGTISPTVSGNFSQGIWTGDVTIATTQSGDKITVVRTSTQVESGQSNAFNVQPGPLDHFAFNSIASPQTAGLGFSITITAMDANNNTVSSFSGTAGLSDLTGTVNPGVTGNFSGGVWSGTVTITQSQPSNRITATSGNKTGTSNNFDVDAAALDYFEISSIGSPQIAGTPFSITIRARDTYGNLVDTYTTPVNLFDNTGTISPVTTGNFSNGVWTGNVSITKSQTDVRITASGSGKQGASNYFNVVPAPLERFSVSTIGTQAAGESFTITVTGLDFYSNRVTDFSGTVDITDLTGTISPTASGNFDQGQWSGAVTITQVMSSDRITVTRSGGTQTGSSNLFDVVAGNVDHFQISAISSPQTAGTPFSVTITAQDANNQTVTNFTGTVNLYDLTGTLSPTVTGNFSGGAWTGNLTVTKSFSNNKISVAGAGKSGESNAFTVQSASIDHFTFATISSPQTAGQPFSLTIEARDVYENIVTSFANTANLSDLTGTLTPAVTGNFSSGTWTGNVTITQSQVDNQISATRSAIAGTSNNFTVSPTTLDHFEISAVSTQTTNEPFSITVIAKDQYGNTAAQFTGKVTISDLTGTISPGLSGSFSQGQWSGSLTISQAYTSDRIHVVRQGGSEDGYSNNFDVVSVNVDHFAISTIGNQTAGTQFSVTIRAEDASNNLVTGFTGTVSLSDLSGTISPVNSGNFSGGTWTGNVVVTKSYSADKITATDASHVGVSNSFTVSPATLDHFSFQEINSPQTAASAFSVTITAKDVYENTVTSHTAPVSLSDNTGTISPVTSGNFSSGVWTGNVTITKSQTDVRITASYSGKQGMSNYFNVDPGALANFDVSNLGTQKAGVPFLLTVTARDAQANVVDDFSGTVDLSDLTGTIEPQVSSNFVNGMWSGNVLVRQATSNDVITVTRTSGTENGQSNAFDVISSQVDTFVISSISSPQTAGAQFTITITAKDADLNTVTSFSGTANLSDLSGTISPQTTGNFSNGVWTGQVSITKSYSSNQIFVNALGESGVSNYFNVAPNALDHFEIQPVNSPQIAGTAFSITITARDAYENKITSFTHAANLSDNSGTLTPATTGNFSAGSWTGNVTITKAQNDVRITAAYNGKQGISNYFNVNPGALASFDLDPVSTQQAGKSFLVTVTARDNFANIATQFTGTVDISDNSGTIEPQISNNFISGVWSGNVMIRQANSGDVITVTRTNGTETGQSNSFDVISSRVDTFVVSTISSPKTAGVPFSVTITAKDADLNTVTNFNGVANLSDLSGTISPQTTGNFVNGVWTGQVTITGYYVSDKITVTALGESGFSNAFDVNPNSLDHFELSSIGSPQVAGTAFSLTITAKDVYENTVLNYTSSVNLSDNTGTLSPITTGNFTAGVWTGNVSITKKQNDVSITATGSGKQGVSNDFNVQSGALDHFTIAPLEDQFAGVPFLLSVSARDLYENVVDAFTGTVDISDISGSVSPTRSGNFGNGTWSGNVVVSQAQNNNRISVVKTNGTESGISNVFDVEAGTVDHFEFSVIGTSQTAGVPISVTISAIDGTGNLVPTFTGTVSLTDLTGTITPATTTAFSNGIWSGTVKITKTYSYNRIFASGIGKSGESNLFNVLPGALDHFALSEIFSPQIAGQPFSVTIAAKDSMENTVTSFFSTVSLTDNTGTISPSATTNFINGEWAGQITITKKRQNVYIRATQLGKFGQSNYFNVNAAQVSYLKIMDAAGGTGQEIGATSLTSKDKLTLYAAGFDNYDNYSHDVFATWGVTGTLDPISPNTGSSVIFEPKTPQTAG